MNTIANTGAIRMERDGKPVGSWNGWPIAGIEVVNDSRSGNQVCECIITDNVIYDNQLKPTCQHGIHERFVRYGDNRDAFSSAEMAEELKRRPNTIRGNLIRNAPTPDDS